MMVDGVVAIIEKDGKYLMIKQPDNKPFGRQWMPISGGLEQDENIETGLRREVKEELGVDIISLNKMAILKADYKAKKLHFFKCNIGKQKIKIDKREIADFGWFTVDKIKKLDLMKATREFFDKYSDKL